MSERMVERRWESTSVGARTLRAALKPASWAYGGVMALRNRAYDSGLFRTHSLGVPTVSVGNLTVGGTGKTPVASWLAERISAHGGSPAILLRGYGRDEILVHRLLTPHAIVEPGADRVASAQRARAAGATAVVLDDGFQHRRVRRDADVVLISADRHREIRLLPAGPWREPFESLSRATHVVVTRKRATPVHAREVLGHAGLVAPAAELSIVNLAPEALVRWGSSERAPVDSMAGMAVLAVSGIGDHRSFESQLRASSARVVSRAFGDHHEYSSREVAQLAHDAAGATYTVCTLKDAVKLGPLWPPSAPPLWYLSQRVHIEVGGESLESLARRLALPANN
ncbi:MAG: tetraacyldisaccharide 4'-kinase [Gemmatimonadetes bacterium]|nr:tetraacyldisaccharide 4'-kinase [Gemmatimonadota bacterium]